MTYLSTNTLLARSCMLALLLGACGESTKSPASNDRQDAGDEAPEDASTGEPEPDASRGEPDAGEEPDAGDEPEEPIVGGPGCGVGSLCLNLRNAYAEELQEVKSCTAGDDQSCGMQAAQALGCDGCPVWVTDTTRLAALAQQFDEGSCGDCFYGSPTGDRCHPLGCLDLGFPMCAPEGTCVANTACPESVVHGASCVNSPIQLCDVEGGGYCLCTDEKWQCSTP